MVEENRFVRSTSAYRSLVDEGLVIDSVETDGGGSGAGDAVVLEHPKIPFWSYPYEWSFRLLQAAAVAHLDIQLRLLSRGIVLSDASAYNIQFLGTRPILVDALSFRRYRESEHWVGARQFQEQFLHPLLLESLTGVAFQSWYRGSAEGIPCEILSSLLPLRHRIGPRTLLSVTLPSLLQRRFRASTASRAVNALAKGLPKSRYEARLVDLRDWIRKLRAPTRASEWSAYDRHNGYDPRQIRVKCEAVSGFVRDARPGLLLDLGCNTGTYAKHALAAGAGRVIGVDADSAVLDRAFDRAADGSLDLLPLYQDILDPSPAQGWDHLERRSFLERCGELDAVLALAFVHHLVLGRNIPLDRAVSRIVSFAPRGLIEFVPKDDPVVRTMLALREDVFSDYSRRNFEAVLSREARIVRTCPVPGMGRFIYEFDSGRGGRRTSSVTSLKS